jgi:hypothetical protein
MYETIVMKKLILSVLLMIYSSVWLLAQETKKVDVDVNTHSSNTTWYTSPWVWIVGVAVFILLLVALTRGSRRAD